MDSDKARSYFLRYCTSVAYVSVQDSSGDMGIGSAVHVGDGVFVTARHVIEDKSIKEVGLDLGLIDFSRVVVEEFADAETEALAKMTRGARSLSMKRGPFFHPDPKIDVAAFVCEGVNPDTPVIPIGTHLDDWINDDAFMLSEAIVMGYPPIPFTTRPHLVCARAEVNAVLDLTVAPHVHFVLSAMPRGGFSGGLVYSEWDFLLGIVTQSLTRNYASEELGFFTAVSVEPIYACLEAHKILPQAQQWQAHHGP